MAKKKNKKSSKRKAKPSLGKKLISVVKTAYAISCQIKQAILARLGLINLGATGYVAYKLSGLEAQLNEGMARLAMIGGINAQIAYTHLVEFMKRFGGAEGV